MNISHRRAVVLAVAGAILTGSSSTLMHLSQAGPATAAFYRSVLALPFLAFMARREALGGRQMETSSVKAALLAGAFLAGDLLLWQRSVMTLGAGVSTVVQDSQVIFVAGISWILFKQSLPARFLPVLTAGVALIAIGGPASMSASVTGTAQAVASAGAYAVYLLLLAQPLSRGSSKRRVLLLVTLSTSAVSVVVGELGGGLELVPGWRQIGWLALLAVTTQVIGWTILLTATARLGTVHASVVLLLQPVAALLWGAVVLGEVPAPWQIVGIVLVLISVAGLSRQGIDRTRERQFPRRLGSTSPTAGSDDGAPALRAPSH